MYRCVHLLSLGFTNRHLHLFYGNFAVNANLSWKVLPMTIAIDEDGGLLVLKFQPVLLLGVTPHCRSGAILHRELNIKRRIRHHSVSLDDLHRMQNQDSLPDIIRLGLSVFRVELVHKVMTICSRVKPFPEVIEHGAAVHVLDNRINSLQEAN